MTDIKDFIFKNKKGMMTLVEYTGTDEKVIIPDEVDGQPVRVIGKDAFALQGGRRNLYEVVLPKDLEVIESFAFDECFGLKSITLPENFREFKQYAFKMCESLEEIHFPKSVEKVPPSTFAMCTSLKKVTCESENTKIAPSAFGIGKSIEQADFHVITSLSANIRTKLLIKHIENFDNQTEELQEQITTYLKKKSAIRKELFMTENAKVIAFLIGQKYKISLLDLDIYLENSIKNQNTIITAMFLEYKEKNFSADTKEKHQENKELVEIGLELPNLKQFRVKWKCVNVDDGIAVTGYKGEETHEVIPTELAGGKKILSVGPFNNVTLGTITSLRIEAPITILKGFSGCSRLEEIYLPDTIKDLEYKGYEGFFGSCKNLKIVNIPKNIKALPEMMFNNCERLEEIVIPENTQEIGDRAFRFCKKLSKITIENPNIIIKAQVFNGCEKLANADGLVIFNNVVYDYVGKSAKIEIPEGVRSISERAFTNNIDLKEVILPKSLEVICENAFSESKIEKIVIPEKITEIKDFTFMHCNDLKEVILPQNLQKIGRFAFLNCACANDIDIPKSVTHIDEQAFSKEVIVDGVKFFKL